ncbi:hypothetical protein F5Y16DRAFT_422055 [Xylariaceae sp. FL0255]|nr:hypothetical protein F5Y16DRAFT_422055 [Xylariaceae sp. FL0255]
MSSSILHKSSEPQRRMLRPFIGLSRLEIDQKVHSVMQETGLPDWDLPFIQRSAYLAQDPQRYRLDSPSNSPCTDAEHDSLSSNQSNGTASITTNVPSNDIPSNVYRRRLIAGDGRVLVDHAEAKYLELEAMPLAILGQHRNIGRKLGSLTWPLWSVIMCCSLGAMVQGLDQTAINGAQIFYAKTFGIDKSDNLYQSTLLGLINGAPYLSGAIVSLFNQWLNGLLGGRRRIIFLTCIFSLAACVGQSVSSTWQALLVTRLLLGFGIGPKSATIPTYAAECAPAKLRGLLVMMWQLSTAFGITLGYVFGIAFESIGGPCRTSGKIELPCSLNWRLMLAVPSLPPILVLLYVFFVPESPRFLIQKGYKATKGANQNEDDNKKRAQKYYQEAFDSLVKLNPTKLQAAQEFFFIYHTVQEKYRNPSGVLTMYKQMWQERRTRYALWASIIVMFFQQFCGMNVFVDYSDKIIQLQKTKRVDFDATDGTSPFYFSLVFGALNFVFSIPALFLIDTAWGSQHL